MRVLMTSATGSIGTYALREPQKEHEVACLVMPHESIAGATHGFSEMFEFYRARPAR